MKRFLIVLASVFLIFGFVGAASAVPVVDVVEFPAGYFLDDEAHVSQSPYYRWCDEDWGWTHSAIAGSFTTATLWISAWDVDYTEIDNIYAYDNGTKVLLGQLTEGNSNYWGYTTFTLSSNFFDDIANGLEIWMDIDSLHSSHYWAVTLAKSVLTLDGGTPPGPGPSVPEPATTILLGTGLLGMVALRRKIKK